ncbi:MAG: taurine dioxygenase [Halioglobus sp.]|jgi:taurine dioxygenase
MTINIIPSGQACGASVSGVDLTQPLDPAEIADIRAAWLEHHVIAFPDQTMSDDDLERFSQYFGDFGDDPFIAAIEGREHIIAVQRSASEVAPLFAENWHTDWSFQEVPPAATCLFGITIPPVGGDTWFNNQHKALDEIPAALREKLEGKIAIHSAKAAYSPDGMYGQEDQDSDRSMEIKPSESANATQLHPIIREHPETGQPVIYGCFGYIVGIEGMSEVEAVDLLVELHEWQTRPEFQYHHQWQKNMLLMWDNRSVLHRATGGYEGHDRLLHRTTIADSPDNR